MELYSDTGDRTTFDEHMVALVDNCDEEDALLAARELESQFGEELVSLDDDSTATEDQDDTVSSLTIDDSSGADADAVEVYNNGKPRLGRLLRGTTRYEKVLRFEADL